MMCFHEWVNGWHKNISHCWSHDSNQHGHMMTLCFVLFTCQWDYTFSLHSVSCLVHKHMSVISFRNASCDQPEEIRHIKHGNKLTSYMCGPWLLVFQLKMTKNVMYFSFNLVSKNVVLLLKCYWVNYNVSHSLPSSCNQGGDHDLIFHQLLFCRKNITFSFQVGARLWKLHNVKISVSNMKSTRKWSSKKVSEWS